MYLLNSLLVVLELHWLTQLNRFQMHNSTMHNLYTALCCHSKSGLCPSAFIPHIPFSYPYPLAITTLLSRSVSMIFLLCSNIYNMKFNILTIFCVSFSTIKYIHIVVPPTSPSFPRTLL